MNTRTEKEIFAELASLCASPGYIHVIAYFCFRDNLILCGEEVTREDMARMYDPSRLVRNEINTLLGLALKAGIDWTRPDDGALQAMAEGSESLLDEIHRAMSGAFFSEDVLERMGQAGFNPFGNGEALREPIFYSGESAYTFQYLDLALRRYGRDADWLRANRGFTIDEAVGVARAIEQVQSSRFNSASEGFLGGFSSPWDAINAFQFTKEEVASTAGLAPAVVEAVLAAFTPQEDEKNEGFASLHDFNLATKSPVLVKPDGKYVSLQTYSLAEAIYESPFYWMASDKRYLPTLTKNRGDFTEEFVAERLARVFGTENVYRNVDVYESKSKRVSDVDVLVLWGNRALVVQTKSKRLTLEARKGNDQVIRSDFSKAVQAAYDQAISCADAILGQGFRFEIAGRGAVVVPPDIAEVYPVTVVSDNYPALSFQARQFLVAAERERVLPPLVLDVFAVDAITEMLATPLRLLSYINRRALHAEQVLASQELTVLGYHLSKNLWVEEGFQLLQLHDDFSTGLDIAMAARRVGLPGPTVPDGVLTRLSHTTIGHVISEIEHRPDQATVELGFHLLALSEDGVQELSTVIDSIAARSRSDGMVHDASFILDDRSGITFHCTPEPASIAGPRLQGYCQRRKYRQHADKWFGVCMAPEGPTVRFGVSLLDPWQFDAEMEARTQGMASPTPMRQVLATVRSGKRPPKQGRNEPCSCGSGKKFKRCCSR